MKQSPSEPETAALFERFEDDRALLVELAGLFAEQIPQFLDRIARAIESRDASQLEYAAHSLKGSLLNLCAPDTAQCAGRLEVMGEKADLATAHEAYAQLVARLTPVVEKLRAIVAAEGEPQARD
jgi:two-component system sensor histidine kinase EvgS